MGIRGINNIKVIRNKNFDSINKIIDNNVDTKINNINYNTIINSFLKDSLSNSCVPYVLRNGFINPNYWDEYNGWVNSEKLTQTVFEASMDGRSNMLQIYFVKAYWDSITNKNDRNPFIGAANQGTPWNDSYPMPILRGNSNPLRGHKELTLYFVETGVFEEVGDGSPTQYQLTKKGIEFAKLYTAFGTSKPLNEETFDELQNYIDNNYPEVPLYRDKSIARLSPGIVGLDEDDRYLVEMNNNTNRYKSDEDNDNIIGRSYYLQKMKDGTIKKLSGSDCVIKNIVKMPEGSSYITKSYVHTAYYQDEELIINDESDIYKPFILYRDRDNQINSVERIICQEKEKIEKTRTVVATPLLMDTGSNTVYPDGPRWCASNENQIFCVAKDWGVGSEKSVISFGVDLNYAATLSKTYNIPIKDIEFKLCQPIDMDEEDMIFRYKKFIKVVATEKDSKEILGISFSEIDNVDDPKYWRGSQQTMVDSWQKMGVYSTPVKKD